MNTLKITITCRHPDLLDCKNKDGWVCMVCKWQNSDLIQDYFKR